MFRRKKKPTEKVPWYRARGYKGKLTESEKRQLDSFRMREPHPAASYDSLPEEVQSYISKLQVELYDKKQESLVGGCLVVSGMGALLLAFYMLGYKEGSLLAYMGSFCLLIFFWVYYPIKWRKNADAFVSASEELLQEWELEYIANKRLAERQA